MKFGELILTVIGILEFVDRADDSWIDHRIASFILDILVAILLLAWIVISLAVKLF